MRAPIIPVLSLLCFASPAAAYELRTDSQGDLVRWSHSVELIIDSRLDDALDAEDATEAIFRAVQTIDDATPALAVSARVGTPKDIGYVVGATDNTNSVVVLDEWPYQAKALAVTLVTINARTNELLDADVAFNASERRFKVLPDQAAMASQMIAFDDVQNTFTHELGHVVGLMHSTMDLEAVMFPSAAPGEIAKRVLKADDRDGLLSLYTEGSALVETPGPAQPAFGCSSTGSTTAGPALLGLVAMTLFARRRRLARAVATSAAVLISTTALAADDAPSLDAADDVALVTVASRESFVHPARPGLILTRLTLARVDCVRGSCAALREVIVPGGRVGDIEQYVSHEPVPDVGAELLITRRLGWAQVVRVDRARQIELVRALLARSPLTSTSSQPQPSTLQPTAITR